MSNTTHGGRYMTVMFLFVFSQGSRVAEFQITRITWEGGVSRVGVHVNLEVLKNKMRRVIFRVKNAFW